MKMRKKELKEKYGYEYAKTVRKIKVGKFRQFYYYNNRSNCKLRTLDSLGSCLRNCYDETIQAIKDVVGGKAFFVNLIYMKDIEALDKHFDRVYMNKVDMGYTRNEGYQYHALYISPNCSKSYKRRLEAQISKSKSEE